MAVTISGNTPTFSVATGYAGGTIASGTAVASTSGTSIDFTGIPSWVKRITVMFNAVSNTSGTSYLVQLGSATFTTSGYVSISNQAAQTNTVQTATSTAGFVLYNSGIADATIGQVVLTLVSGNIWVASHTAYRAGWVVNGAGGVTLSGTLDRVRITSTSGTDAFDAGSINILYE